MANKNKTGNTYNQEEDFQIQKLDIIKICKREINNLKRLVKDKEFATSLKLQKQAALIVRGIYFKYQSITAVNDHMTGDIDEFFRSISSMANKYENLFSGQSVKISLEDGDGNAVVPMLVNLVSFKDVEMKKPDDPNTE